MQRDYRLIAFDLRGHGQSDEPLDESAYHDPTLWADDVRAVMQQLSLTRAIICAWSFGTAVIGDYLQVYGEENVAALHFISGVPGPDVAGEGWLQLAPKLLAESPEENQLALQELIRLLHHEPLKPDDARLWLRHNLNTPPHVRMALMNRPPRATPVAGLFCPILLTHGLNDRITLPVTMENARKRFPHAQVSYYPQVGHVPQWEAPERFNEELHAFVQSL